MKCNLCYYIWSNHGAWERTQEGVSIEVPANRFGHSHDMFREYNSRMSCNISESEIIRIKNKMTIHA